MVIVLLGGIVVSLIEFQWSVQRIHKANRILSTLNGSIVKVTCNPTCDCKGKNLYGLDHCADVAGVYIESQACASGGQPCFVRGNKWRIKQTGCGWDIERLDDDTYYVMPAMEPADCRYGACHGEPELLLALREKLERENGIDMAEREVMVTNGANQAQPGHRGWGSAC